MVNILPETTNSDATSPLDELFIVHHHVLSSLNEQLVEQSILEGLGGGGSLFFPYNREMSPHERLGLLKAFPCVLFRVLDHCFVLLEEFTSGELEILDYVPHFRELLFFLGSHGKMNVVKANIAIEQLQNILRMLPVKPEVDGGILSLRAQSVLTMMDLGFTGDVDFFRSLASEDPTSGMVVFQGFMNNDEDIEYEAFIDWLKNLPEDTIISLFTVLKSLIDRKCVHNWMFSDSMNAFLKGKGLSSQIVLPGDFSAGI